MNEAFLRGFADEMAKLAGIDPLTLKALSRKLITAGKIGAFGAGVFAGYKALKHFADTVDYATWFPGRRR